MVPGRIRYALLFACAIALVPCGHISAQTPASRRWPDHGLMSPNREQADAVNWDMDGQYAPFGKQPVRDVQAPVARVVTLHELEHRVPRRAAKEYERALKATAKGDNGDAIPHFQKAISIDPEFSDALNDLGTTYLQLGRIDFAIEQFNQAIRVDPHASKPCSNLAIAYLCQRQYRDAERTARRAVDLDRGSTHGLLVLAVSLILDGRFSADAERMLTKAAGEFTIAKFWLAVGLIQRGDIAKAKDQLKTYLADGDKNGAEVASAVLQRLESLPDGQQRELARVQPNRE